MHLFTRALAHSHTGPHRAYLRGPSFSCPSTSLRSPLDQETLHLSEVSSEHPESYTLPLPRKVPVFPDGGSTQLLQLPEVSAQQTPVPCPCISTITHETFVLWWLETSLGVVRSG